MIQENRARTIRHRAGTALIAVLTGIVAACAATGDAVPPLTDRDGRTLYSFAEDKPGSGESGCYGDCAARWPPVPAANASGEDFGSITRADGTRQLTYQGQPLYYFAGDGRSGDVKGDGVDERWQAVRPGSGSRGEPMDIGDVY